MKKFFDYSIYSLAVFLAFLLVFERFLELPFLVNWLGHWHPLILHFPIVLILVSIIQYWRKDQYFSWYLAVTTLLTLISAITGFILSLDSGVKGNLILTHQWLGIAVSFIMVIWYFFESSISRNQIKVIQGFLVIIIVATGHFGGMVTHGQDFLSFGNSDNDMVVSLPDDPNIYTHIVQPVLDRKCVSCHNENKAKGELMLSDFARISEGGKSGSALDPKQGILARINLPLDHEEHMPPKDEQQLAEDEFTILKKWIEGGSSENTLFSELSTTSELHGIIGQLIEQSKASSWADLPELSNDEVDGYSSDYCTVRRIYNGSDALQVLIFPHEAFNTSELKELDGISENIIDLNLSNLPISEKDIKVINGFNNLEILDVSGSSITNQSVIHLGRLEKLKTLKIYNTLLDDESIKTIGTLPNLQRLYAYETAISISGKETLQRMNPMIAVISHSELAAEFKSVLPSPILDPVRYFFRESFFVKLDHPLDNIDIKYTIDGTNPDVNSSSMKDSLLVEGNYSLKYFAAKEDWESSPIDSIQFMKSDIEPSNYELLHSPDQKYLGIGKSLLFDLEKGSANFGDDKWMAFKDNPFSLTCIFDEIIPVSEVALSSMVNTDPYLFPPSKIRIYGGKTEQALKLIGSLSPDGLRERSEQHFEFYEIEIRSTNLKYMKIVVDPLDKIPMWHRGKGEKGWFFIDEVIITSN